MSSSFFTLCTDESMCAMRSALSVPIQMEVDVHELVFHVQSWHLHQFRWLVHRFSGNKDWIGKHTNCRNVHEGKALYIWASPLPIFPCSDVQRISQRIFWFCVFRSRTCGFSIGVLFPTIIVVRIFWNFRVKFNSKLVCRWWEGTWQGNMRVSSTFLFRDIDVKLIRSEWWFWVRDWKLLYWQVIWNIRGNAWSLIWCQLCASLNWLMRFVESHVLVIALVLQAEFDRSSMDRMGCGFFDHFVDASQFFCLSQI